MKLKRILLFGIVMIFMTGTLSTEAATTQSAAALEPWTSGIIDQAAGKFLGQHVSIDHNEYNGRAFVSYYDASGKNLKLAHEVSPGTGDCPGNANWDCELVDDGFVNIIHSHDVGQYSSIEVIDDTYIWDIGPTGDLNAQPNLRHYAKIGISYYDATDRSLKFALYSCDDACGWIITEVNDDTTADNDENIGQYSSFQFGTNETPVIYYHSGYVIAPFVHTGKVKYAYVNSDVSGKCDSGWSCEVVAQSSASSGFGTYISADGGRVVFYDAKYDDLIMANPTGSVMSNSCGLVNYWGCQIIDSFGDVGKFASLFYDGENPMQIAYYDATDGKVMYAVSTNMGTGCYSEDFNCFAVDTIGVAAANSHVGISLDLDAEGAPIIAYQDFSEDQDPSSNLKLARPASVYDQLVGNCGDVPPGYLFNYWQCSYLDNGGQYGNEADYVAVSVSPAGLATVAYYEHAEVAQGVFEGHLKVAQQHFMIYLPLIMK